jgi:hypothetical protein
LQFFANQPILNSGQSHRILRREVARYPAPRALSFHGADTRESRTNIN